jgi:hypothetical protein
VEDGKKWRQNKSLLLKKLIPRKKRGRYLLIALFCILIYIISDEHFGYDPISKVLNRDFITGRHRTIYFENPDDSKDRYPDSRILRPEVCIISASYTKDASRMDNLYPVINKSPYIRFFLFTNLNDDEWHTPGWEKIITQLEYRRSITHSRYGKFLGWKFKQIRECRAVFYMDSCVRPDTKVGSQKVWREVAARLESSEIGLMQKKNPRKRSGLFGEFLAIQSSKKDAQINIVNSLKWMVKQPDFDPDIPIYWNEHFGYDPNSKVFQNLSQAFWDHYSLEQDSWRDQPLWSFMLNRHNITPLPWPQGKTLFTHSTTDYGHNGHVYQSEEDVLANWG